MPIGHIIDRNYACISTQDSSHHAVGVQIPRRKTWMILPFLARLFRQIKEKNTKFQQVHINVLEFIAIFIGFLMLKLDHEEDPESFPPHPTMLSLGDNKSANSWAKKFNTESMMGQNALQLFAEYVKHSNVALSTDHI